MTISSILSLQKLLCMEDKDETMAIRREVSIKDYSHPEKASFLEFIKKQGKEFLPGRDF